MTATQAQARIEFYLKSHNIQYQKGVEDEVSRITILYTTNCDRCPDGILESCIWFFNDVMEARVFFDQNAADCCRDSSNINELLRLFNFINARVWKFTTDGAENTLYQPSLLYNPRIYMTEDDRFDITLTSMINYDFYDLAPLETEDFLTDCCPSLLDELSPAIFSVVLGTMNVEEAIMYVKRNVLNEE